jgi:hypothetical protein
MKHTHDGIEELKAKGVQFDTPRLELAKKDEAGIPRSNGIHNVTILRDERRDDIIIFVGANTQKEVAGIRYWFDEGGIEKYYDVPFLGKDGKTPHYLISHFDELNEGDKVVIQYVKKGDKGYIDVQKAGGVTTADKVPTIHYDDEGNEIAAG